MFFMGLNSVSFSLCTKTSSYKPETFSQRFFRVLFYIENVQLLLSYTVCVTNTAMMSASCCTEGIELKQNLMHVQHACFV